MVVQLLLWRISFSSGPPSCFCCNHVVYSVCYFATSACRGFVRKQFKQQWRQWSRPDPATTHSESSFTKTYYLLWNVCKDNKKPLFFTALLLASLVVILRGEPLGYIQNNEQTRSVLEEISSHSVILRFAVGIVLPVSLNDLICARLKENEMKIIVT